MKLYSTFYITLSSIKGLPQYALLASDNRLLQQSHGVLTHATTSLNGRFQKVIRQLSAK